MSDLIKAFDRPNPEHRDIDNQTYLTSDGMVEIKTGTGSVQSDMVLDFRDSGEGTDRRYSMVLGEEL